MKKYNINSYIYIQIMDIGWTYLGKTVGAGYIKHCIYPHRVEINNKPWYKLQAHEAFSLFPINFGGQPLFLPNVMFDDKDLEDIN